MCGELTVDTDPASGTSVPALAPDDGNSRLSSNTLPAAAFLDTTSPVVADNGASVGVLGNPVRSSDNGSDRTSKVSGGSGEDAGGKTENNRRLHSEM